MNFQKFTYPNSPYIKILRETDFSLETRDKICLYDDSYVNIVLIYNESPDSERILNVIQNVAGSIPGVSFSVCNIQEVQQVANVFLEITTMKFHPLREFTLRPFPFVLVYKRGFPVNFYDGPADTDIFRRFCERALKDEDFHITNKTLNEQIKYQMWSEYKSKNPMAFSTLGRSQRIVKKPYIPAVPSKQISELDE
jgi:hypothetical protein